MAVETITKEAAQAVQYFESKLAFEIGPVGLHYALKNKEPIQIIDLRTPELYAAGHVPGAINLAYEDLEKNFNKLSKDKTIVVYCYDIVCHLATKAALLLAKKGYKVKELYGGWQDWASHELQVEGKTEKSSCSSSASSCG